MNLRIKPRMRLVILAWFIFALTGCQPKIKDSSQATLLQTPELQLLVSPAQIPVETPLTMTLQSKEALNSVTGELRGVSMYMGRIPLQWRQAEATANTETTVWIAEFFLGACSDPAMQWQLQLWLEYADGRRESQTVQFSSSWR